MEDEKQDAEGRGRNMWRMKNRMRRTEDRIRNTEGPINEVLRLG